MGVLKRDQSMQREDLARAAVYVIIGIFIGLAIGWYIWHGAGSGTCPVPVNAV
jgi:hypothetical protein